MNVEIQLVLVTPEIPANTGNIVRLCAATGVPLHLVEPLGFSWDDRVLKRAGLDYWELCQIKRHLTFEEVEQQAGRCLYLSAHASRSFFEARIEPGDFLVLGPESEGLSREFLAQKDRKQHSFKIPMPREKNGRSVRSLNLSTAAGIVVYESLRQLNGLTPIQGADRCQP